MVTGQTHKRLLRIELWSQGIGNMYTHYLLLGAPNEQRLLLINCCVEGARQDERLAVLDVTNFAILYSIRRDLYTLGTAR